METIDDVPVIDLQVFFDRKSEVWEEECKKVALSLHKFGILIVKDPRVNEQENENYIDMVEKYFDHTAKKFYAGEELADRKPELHFQTGVTTER
jgi:isopenicillin N synthase-like dioxygenase